MTNQIMLKTRNTALYEALKLFVVEAFQVLVKVIGNGAKVPMITEFCWQPGGPAASFLRTQITRPEYWLLIHEVSESIKELAAYEQAKTAIQEDQLWCSHMDKLVGSAMGSRRLGIDDVLRGILAHHLMETDQFDLSEAYFDEHVDRLEAFFHSSTVEYIRTTPLYGVTLQKSLSFSDAVSIEPLSDSEILHFLNAGLISSDFYGSHDFVHNSPRAAMVSRFSMPKVIRGDHDPAETNLQAVTEVWNRLTVDESMAIDLLTLHLDARIAPAGSITKSQWLMDGSSQIQKNAIANAWALQGKPLTEEASDKFSRLWSVLNDSSKKSRHFLAIAVRRFALAMSRPSLDDKLIDLMICAEAIFLRVDMNELTYKLAHRAALLLGETPTQQADIFKFIKEAYAMRSKVVHGNKSYARDPKDAEQLSLIIAKLSDYLRQALLKMFALALNPQAHSELINWNDLMFCGTTPLDIPSLN
ncbi:MAG: hypothetical protein AB1642_06825 [Pseudomonadota bacterium]